MIKFVYRAILTIIIPLITTFSAYSQQLEYRFNLSEMFPIGDFKLEKSDGIQVVALKSGETDPSIEGIYTFVINGYIENINFKNGKAKLSDNFSSSEIFYIKHEKQTETLRHLYYSVGTWVVPIPFWLLLIIPITFIVLAMFIKRILFIILLLGFVLFFVLQGLDMGSFYNLIKETIANFLN